MTDRQLYLAIGIPSALFMLNFLGVLAGFFWQSKHFDDMASVFRSEVSRVEGVLGAKIDTLGTKIDALGQRVKSLEDFQHSPLVKR